MSIQSVTGAAVGNAPQATQVRSSPPPVAEATVKLPDTPAKSASPPKTAPGELQKALDTLKQAVSTKSSVLQFSLDESSGQTIARVVDSETGELIRQMPSKELLEIAHAIDKMQGILLKQKA
jgi:flagellar protein FlaG